jgi:hypothetical protein
MIPTATRDVARMPNMNMPPAIRSSKITNIEFLRVVGRGRQEG